MLSSVLLALALAPVGPTEAELRAAYKRADTIQTLVDGKHFNVNLTPVWIDSNRFIYDRELPDGKVVITQVDAKTGTKSPLFDHELIRGLLAKINEKPVPETYRVRNVSVDGEVIRFNYENTRFELRAGNLTKTTNSTPASQRLGQRNLSPDGLWSARIEAGKLKLADAKDSTKTLSEVQLDSVAQFQWSPNSKRIAVWKLIPGERRQIALLESSPRSYNSRANLKQRLYDQPGDKLDQYELYFVDPATSAVTKAMLDPIMGGGQPWSGPPGIAWRPLGFHARIEFPIRGYQENKVVEVDAQTGISIPLIEEKSKTFIDQGRQILYHFQDTNQLLWRSERDGWGHLYLIEPSKPARQLTQGEWVVRSLEHVDEKTGWITFMANGREPGDPYLQHGYRVNLNGKLEHLTPGEGTHRWIWSPDRTSFVDTYSRVDQPPVHTLRRADGTLVAEIEKADVSKIKGLNPPEVFKAKGRDGKTDIWGIVVRPSNWDKKKKYPVIEDIYAGPHDSHVPKVYRPLYWHQRLAELGFIVVQIDGMGTNNRGKAFHDVAYQNLRDAGFLDRIAWMKSLAAKDPSLDLTRVGIYGTSAGGQNAAAAVLWHHDFYKAAVASCGCHDNRIDKQWWNEQWLGYPVNPSYVKNSNIENAGLLGGQLLLMVGELDTNVPPESTFRFADALIKAGKEFELVVIPGADHTAGGPYGERKRRDFFVKTLLGVSPPDWNR